MNITGLQGKHLVISFILKRGTERPCEQWLLTSFWRAEAALPRYEGSNARSIVNKPKEDEGKSLKASEILDL